MSKIEDVRLRIMQQVAKQSKEADINRQVMCQMLSTKDYKEEEACKLMDSLLLQYESVGILKGELQAYGIFESLMEDKPKPVITQAYF